MSEPVLTCTILTHPQRQARAIALAAQLLPLAPSVLVDRTNTPGNLQAAMLAWAEHAQGGYHMVIQDDAVPVAGFARSAQAAVLAAPAGAAVAFWTRPWHPSSPSHAAAVPGSLVQLSVLDHWPPTVALALPAERISSLLDHQWRCHPHARYDDDVIGCWMAEESVPLYVTSPCIVEHDDRVASLLNGGRRRHLAGYETHLATKAPAGWRVA